MEMFYYTVAALILYGISDYILNSIEIRMGKRLPNRSFIFFIIIAILSLLSFSAIRSIVSKPDIVQQTTNTQVRQPENNTDSNNSTRILPAGNDAKKIE